ncbi:MAG: alpha/beta fold hydrolase [Deltaproteobacteria bacterium]|nr:alpha/beta fold hydrolase [Deltaproteobacteria bacterium]
MNMVSGQAARVSINGLKLNARIDGTEGAPWMVCCNSLSVNLSAWDGLAAAFGSRFRLLRYDQRGHGDSDAPAEDFSMDDLASDLLALMDGFHVDKAVLVGVSMGCVTVLRCAARAPSRCLGVVGCDGYWRSMPGAAAMWEERFALARKGGMEAMAEPTVRRWFQPDFFTREPDEVKRIKAMVAATKLEGYFGCGRALQGYDFSADHPALSVPALFLAGAQDGDLPKLMKEMADATPGGRLQIIDDCGHLPNIEQPDAFRKALDAFVHGLRIV